MQPTAIFGPFFATILLTLAVWVYMYVRRIHHLRAPENRAKDPVELVQSAPPAVANPSDNLKNLFELPVIFYALALYLFATSQVDAAHVTAAWIFFLLRVGHSAVHCTFNLIPLRFALYLVSSLALWFMALRAALAYVGAWR
jgi:hypothetical protein